jgi:hypothetical protein
LEGRHSDDSWALADSRLVRDGRCVAHVLPDDMSKFVRRLYRSARMANDIETLASGNPKRITRRAQQPQRSTV